MLHKLEGCDQFVGLVRISTGLKTDREQIFAIRMLVMEIKTSITHQASEHPMPSRIVEELSTDVKMPKEQALRLLCKMVVSGEQTQIA